MSNYLKNIIILEADANRIGDLFSRLVGDYFHALGYDDARFNIHKSGREVDVEAFHRTEKRRVIAECKATQDKIGGDAINKFVGVLDVEKRKKTDEEVVGYFVSLSGFKETAIEQEKEIGNNRLILVNATQIIQELIRGNIIVPQEQATEIAGRCASRKANNLDLHKTELLAHELGWIWLVSYSHNKEITAFSLIHADGKALSTSQARKIIKADVLIGGNLSQLIYLEPPQDPTMGTAALVEIKNKYFKYLSDECGEIQLEGLPADQEVGSRRLRLESIFVPLHLKPAYKYDRDKLSEPDENIDAGNQISLSQVNRESVGSVLSKNTRLAILASPGGGKSTLLKRIAIAYAFPDRRKLIADNLPNREYLPLFIRCRQIVDAGNASIEDVICTIAYRAEMSQDKGMLTVLVHNALRNGEALLLIDGLDEISEEGARLAFVRQLRTFMATYPACSLILTSREAGFRIVGQGLLQLCRHYMIADLNGDDIRNLTIAWHKEVIGDKQSVISEAEKLADSIRETDRVRRLAQNPLLLTTLLLVKRWVGQLPTRRTVLYGKAIEVLLMTWNVEGHAPLDQDEVIPQLAFVAYTMMKDGIQRISLRRLKEVLTLARGQMPEILGFAKLSVNEFVQRVEQRSSLMMLCGHQVEQGTLYPMYEFRHLTFQEYLTAKAIVEGYFPDRKNEDTLLSVLETRLDNQSWREVIPLTAVLAGRNTQILFEHLIGLTKKLERDSRDAYKNNYPVVLLANCILDEVLVSPDMLKTALEWIVRRDYGHQSVLIRSLYRGRHGDLLLNIIKEKYMTSSDDLLQLGSALALITLAQTGFKELKDFNEKVAEKLKCLLRSGDPMQKVSGAAALMEAAYLFKIRKNLPDALKKPQRKDIRGGYLTEARKKLFFELADQLLDLLYSGEKHQVFIACWALAWLGTVNLWTPKHKIDTLNQLLTIWRESDILEIQYVAAWALSALPIIDKDIVSINTDLATEDFIKANYHLSENDFTTAKINAAQVIAFYIGKPWEQQELSSILKLPKCKLIKDRRDAMLSALRTP